MFQQLSDKSTLIVSALFIQFEQFFSIIGLDKDGHQIPFPKFNPLLTLQQLQLHLFICKFAVFQGTYQNKLKTPEQKMLGALYHFSCILFLHNQQFNYFQQYFDLVLQSLGLSKLTLIFNNVISNTTSYQTAKLFLDKHAANFQQQFDTTFPPSTPLLFG